MLLWARYLCNTTLAAGLLLVVAGLLGVSTATNAQTTLVSNTGQDNSLTETVSLNEFAQAFGTGSHTAGYDLASIVLSLGAAPTGTGTLTVTVRADASGDPSGTALHTLTTPDPFAENALKIFTAPAGATLDANTTYWVVASYSANSGGPKWRRTLLSNGIDSGGAAGWTIDSPFKTDRRADPDGWEVGSSTRALKLQVKGTARGGTTFSTDATLSALAVNDGTTEHTIDLATTPYTVNVGNAVTTVTLTATPTHTGASVSAVTLGGTAIADIDFTDGITVPSLAEGDNEIDVTVTAEDGSATETYMVTVTRAGTTTTAPAIVTGGVRATSMPLVGDTYGLGETIAIWVTFDNAVTVGTSGGTPRIQFRLDGAVNKWAEYSSSFSSIDLVFTYVVQSGDMDADGIWLEADFLQLQGGTISAAADNTVNATLTYDRPGTQIGHKVNTSLTVPSNWNLKPSGLSAGDEFRLLFLTSTTRRAQSAAIADYNTFVQNRAAAGHMDIQSYSSGFSAVASTAAVNARANTGTAGTGVPIYWLGGAKLADDYADFYNGSWDDEVNLKDESRNAVSRTNVWTGNHDDGSRNVPLGAASGNASVGKLNEATAFQGR